MPYSTYMDLVSAANYWWVQEFSSNQDAFITTSTYLYKKRDIVLDNGSVQNGKLYWGPLWDFDYAYRYDSEESMGSLCTTSPMAWIDRMRSQDPEFQQLLLSKWRDLKEIVLDVTKKNGVLDQYAEEIESSWASNYELWKDKSFAPLIPFAEGIRNLKSDLDTRREAVDQVVESAIGKVYATVTFMAGDEVVKTCQVRIGAQLDRDDIPGDPVKDGYFFLGWMEADGSSASPYKIFEKDETIYANFIPDADVIRPDAIFFEQYEQWANVEDASKWLYYETVPAVVQDKRLTWTSSDPRVAEVTSNDRMLLLSTGDTTITCKAANGVSNSMVLHVYDPKETPVQNAESIELERDSLAMLPGEFSQVPIRISPQPAEFSIEYESSDEDVAAVDEFGLVNAVAPGTCTITANG